MMSLNLLLFLLFLSIISYGEGGKKKNVDKIIIHVPYKIFKHHHTHTKYKIITIPEKKEKTVIYVKALDKQPNTKYSAITHFPETNLEMEIIKRQPKAFYPSEQWSDSSVQIIKDQEGIEPTDQQQEFSNNIHSVKPAQFHIVPHHKNAQDNFIHKFTYPTIISHSYKVPQKPILIHTMLPPPSLPHTHSHHFHPHQGLNPTLQLKPKIHPSKQLQHHKENMHSSSNIYKTTITPKLPKRSSSYMVREPNQEDHHIHLAEYQPKQLLKNFKVPSVKLFDKKTPIYLNQDNEFLNTNSKESEIKQGTETEYEHVGYLVIDENSQKILDKNFNEKSWG